MIVIYLYFGIISHQQTKPTSSKIKQFNNKHIDNKVASICVTGSTLKYRNALFFEFISKTYLWCYIVTLDIYILEV